MIKHLYKDKKKRHLILTNENKQFILKSIYKNTNVLKTIRWNSGLKFTTFKKSNYKTNLVNRCVITGRKKQINKNFRFSRLSFLKLARNGYVSGLIKSTW